MANWVITDQRIGLPRITTTSDSSTPAVPPGTICRAVDVTAGASTTAYGIACEFIYLAGVASTTAGSAVIYDENNNTTTLAPTTVSGANPVAIAMAANTSAATYGWYMIEGVAAIKKTAVKVSPNVPMYISATAGRLMPTIATGKALLGCRSVNAATVASATSTVNCHINRPHFQLLV